MSESIFKEVTLRRKEILEKVNPKNVELAQSYLKYINISNFEKSTVSTKIQLLLHYLNYIHEKLQLQRWKIIFCILANVDYNQTAFLQK